MDIQFATCDRRKALEFLRHLLPSKNLQDTPESVGPFLDLVEADVIRVQDPMMHLHNGTIAVVPSKNWTEERRDEVMISAAILDPQTPGGAGEVCE